MLDQVSDSYGWGSTTLFEPEAETMPAAARAELQSRRLQALVDRLLAAGGLQGRRLRQAGVTSGDGLTVGDLPRLPMVVKQDLWDSYPLGMLAVPPEQVVAVHGSSGTGGRPTL